MNSDLGYMAIEYDVVRQMGFFMLCLIERRVCYCSSWSTSLFVTGQVSRQLSGHLPPDGFLPLTSNIGKMLWNLMMSATVSNICGEIRGELQWIGC